MEEDPEASQQAQSQSFPLTDDAITSYQTKKWFHKCSIITTLTSFITKNTSYTIDNYTLLSTFISLCLNDSNINVNIAILTFLSTFTPLECNSIQFKEMLTQNMLVIVSKYKEKKEKLTEQVNTLLTLILKYTMTIKEVLECIREYPSDKSIIYKSSITEFVFVNLRKTKLSVVVDGIDVVVEVFAKLVGDSNSDVRNCALSSLALVRRRVGKKRFEMCQEVAKIGEECVAEIEQVAKNVNYDRKYDDIEREESENEDEGREEEEEGEGEVEEVDEEVEEEDEDNGEEQGGDDGGEEMVNEKEDEKDNGNEERKEMENESEKEVVNVDKEDDREDKQEIKQDIVNENEMKEDVNEGIKEIVNEEVKEKVNEDIKEEEEVNKINEKVNEIKEEEVNKVGESMNEEIKEIKETVKEDIKDIINEKEIKENVNEIKEPIKEEVIKETKEMSNQNEIKEIVNELNPSTIPSNNEPTIITNNSHIETQKQTETEPTQNTPFPQSTSTTPQTTQESEVPPSKPKEKFSLKSQIKKFRAKQKADLKSNPNQQNSDIIIVSKEPPSSTLSQPKTDTHPPEIPKEIPPTTEITPEYKPTPNPKSSSKKPKQNPPSTKPIPIQPSQFNTEPLPIQTPIVTATSTTSTTTITDHQQQQPLDQPNDDSTNPEIKPKTSSINDFERKLAEAMELEAQQRQQQQSQSSSSLPSSTPLPKKRTEEDAEYTSRISSLYPSPSELLALCDNPKWDEKKKGFTLLSTFISSNKSLISSSKDNQDTLFNYLRIKLNNFKETNMNLIKEAYLCFHCLFQVPIHRTYLETFLKSCHEKLADTKLKETLTSILSTAIDNYTPNAVLSQLLTLINNNKKAKLQVMKEYSSFFEKVIDDYGVDTIDLKPLLLFAVNLANNTNPQARTAATSLICVLYKYIGKDINSFLKEIKESTLKLIEQEMSKVTVLDKQQFKPKKQSKADATQKTQVNKELIPRSDISKGLNAKLLNNINNGKWSDKKEGIEAIQKLLATANNKILPNGLKELFTLIKAKLSDGNKNLVRLIIQLLSQLIEALGPGLKQYTKLLGVPLLSVLADKQSLLRDDCVACVDKWVQCFNYESIACYYGVVLKNENFELRTEILKMLIKYKDKYKEQGFNNVAFFKEIAMPLLVCLQDKSNVIRNQIEEIIVISLQFIKIKYYYNLTSEFKPAIANTLSGILNKLKTENNINEDNVDDNEGNNVSNEGAGKKAQVKKKKDDNNANYNSNNANTNKTSKTPTKHKGKERVNTINEDNNEHNNNNKTGTNKQQQPTSRNVNNNNKSNKNLSVKNKTNNNNISKSPLRSNKSIDDTTNALTSNSTIINNKHSLKKGTNDTTTTTNATTVNNNTSTVTANNNVSPPSIFLSHYKPRPNTKDKRFESDKKSNFNIESNNFDYFNKIKETLKLIFTSEHINNMYNTDIKKNILSLTSMQTALHSPKNQSNILDNLDLILKYIAWKLYTNQNSTLCKTVFDFCEFLTKVDDIKLNEIELNILFNLFVDKLTSSVSSLKETAKDLLCVFILLATPTKAFKMLLNIAVFKPNKTRSAIIDSVCTIYSQGDINEQILKKNCKLIMKVYCSGDNAVRNKMVDLVKEVFKVVKNEMFKYCGELNEKEITLLKGKVCVYEEEDIMNEDDDDDEVEIEIKDNDCMDDNEDIAFNFNEVNESKPRIGDKHKVNTITTSQQCNYINNNNTNHVLPITQEQLNNMLNDLQNPHKNILESLTIINNEIYGNYTINQSILNQNSNSIYSVLIKLLSQLLSEHPLQVKLTKYISNTLCHISQLKPLISPLSNAILKSAIITILNGVLYDNLSNLGENSDGACILKNLDITMIRIIDYCDKTDILAILIELETLYRLTQPKLAEFSARCIRKISDNIERYIHSMNISAVLVYMHEFFISYEEKQPDLQIKTQTDQLIITTLKGLVSAMTQVLETKIVEDYGKGVEQHEVKDKYIKRWIRNDLEMKGEKIEGNVSVGENSSNSNTQSDKLNQLKLKLTSLHKGTSLGQAKLGVYSGSGSNAQSKSFNQIQKKWKDVFNRTQRSESNSGGMNENVSTNMYSGNNEVIPEQKEENKE